MENYLHIDQESCENDKISTQTEELLVESVYTRRHIYFHPLRCYPKTNLQNDSVQKERSLTFLRNEINIVKELSHPSIIKVLNIYETRYHILIVMEHAKCSLTDYILNKGGKLDEYECVTIIKQILEGLKNLHISNIVHRDLKPDNILLMSSIKLEGMVKITDFTFATKLTNSIARELTSMAGTYRYMAPELLDGGLCTTVYSI